MTCPNCFFENSDETKRTCPFCGHAYPEQAAPSPQAIPPQAPTLSVDDLLAGIAPKQPPSGVSAESKPSVEADGHVSPIPEKDLNPAAESPQASADTAPVAEAPKEKTPDVKAPEEAPHASQKVNPGVHKRGSRLPVWAQILIWTGAVAAAVAASYFFNSYASENLEGWSMFWNNIFYSWR